MPAFFTSFFQLQGKRFPFVGLVFAAMAGILGEEFLAIPSHSLGGLMLFLVLLFFLFLKGERPQKRGPQGIIFLIVATAFAIFHAWQWQEATSRQWASFFNEVSDPIVLEGYVASKVKLSRQQRASFIMEVTKVIIKEQEIKPDIKVGVSWEGATPAFGDALSFRALVHAPMPPRNPGEFNFVSWLARQAIYTECTMDPSDPGKILPSQKREFLRKWAVATKSWIEQKLSLGISSEKVPLNVIQGIVLGATDHEEEEWLSDFKQTGTMHLFAVSGLHVGMVAIILWFLLKMGRFPRRFAVLVAIPLLFFYGMVTGMHIGSIRAAIMASVMLTGFLLYRRSQMINSLGMAAFLLLLSDTNLLFSVGWQFSFSVVLAILLLATPFQKLLEPYYAHDPFIPKRLITSFQKNCYASFHHLAQLGSVSLAAWIGSLIPCGLYFHTISFSALGANLIAVPLAFLILVTAAAALAIASFSSWMALIFNNANVAFAKVLLMVVHGWALVPGSTCAVGWIQGPLPRITLFDFPNAQGAVLQDGGHTWVINTGGQNQTQKILLPFLEEQGIRHLEGMLLTGKDAAHLGGAASLMAQTKPLYLLLPPGKGRSPFWKQLQKELRQSGQEATLLSSQKKVSFSLKCWGELFYPPPNILKEGVVLKIHCQEITVLILPVLSLALEQWLLKQLPLEQEETTIMLLPGIPSYSLLEDPLIIGIAPQAVIIGRSFGRHTFSKEMLKEHLHEKGIELLPQEEWGAVTLEVGTQEKSLGGFLNKKRYPLPVLKQEE